MKNEKQSKIEDTAILEYLDIFKMEYEREFNKKQNFDNRAGLILTLLGAISIFLFENIKIKETLLMMKEPITFMMFLQIVSVLTIFISFIFTLIMAVKTIMVKHQKNFGVGLINDNKLQAERIEALTVIISGFKEIIINNRVLNEERAETFHKALIGMVITIIAVITYIAVTM